MTLNLIIVTPKMVYQGSDFRLTYRNGTITDHEAQKIVPVVTANWSALVQYTGVAKTNKSFDTSRWLADLPSVDWMAPRKWLKDKLLEAGRNHIGLSERHTFSAVGYEGTRPFVLVVSNFQSIDATRPSTIPKGRRNWDATEIVGRHGAFATGDTEHVYSNELRGLPKFARTHPTNAVHRKLADLNRKAAERANRKAVERGRTDGSISESCFTGQISLNGGGTLMPHDVNPGGEYMPRFAIEILDRQERLGGEAFSPRIIARTDDDGNPLPRRLVQMTFARRNAPSAVMYGFEFQATADDDPPSDL